MKQSWCKESVQEGRREQAQELISSRQRTPSDSYVKVTASAALQLLLLPVVSASPQPSRQPVREGTGLGGTTWVPAPPWQNGLPSRLLDAGSARAEVTIPPHHALPLILHGKPKHGLYSPPLTSAVYCS